MGSAKDRTETNQKKGENLQPGEYGVPEAPPADQKNDPNAGLKPLRDNAPAYHQPNKNLR